jgi:iron complex outermembrane recepter protein
VTALVRYQADLWNSFEGGYSMKTRAPSLYELYAWSTNKMGAEMNGWGGDGNMYIGNNNLKPETAHTLSVTYDLHEARPTKDGGGNGDWELKVTPYYSYVEDYIDVRKCTASDTHGAMGAKCNPQNAKGAVELIYVNQDAQIFGADLYARVPLMRSFDYGKLSLVGIAGYDRGMNLSRGGNLYHMMPLNAKLTLEHKLGNWSSAAEMVMVSNKDEVEAERRELQTPGYALVNLRSSYQWENIRFDLGVENLFNQQYYSPLGGAYLGEQAAGKAGWMGTGSFEPLAGMGRNIYGGITVKF